MTKRRAIVAVGLLALVGLGAWLWLGSSPRDTSPTPAEASSDAPAVTVLNALLSRPVSAPQGSLHIRGKVLSGKDPVGEATVTVTRLEVGERLSDHTCACTDSCGLRLIDCGCGGSVEQLLTLINQREGEVEPLARTQSGADGAFDLEGLGAGTYTVWADAKTGSAVLSEVAAGEEKAELDLVANIELAGKVLDESRKPVDGARVIAALGAHARELEVMTGADGTFRFGSVPRGDYAVLATADGWVPAHVHTSPESTEPVSLTLLRPRKISGTVVQKGKPVAAARVESRGDHRIIGGRTDAQGRFALTGMRPGDYDVVAQSEAGLGHKEVKVGKDDVGDVVLELGPAGSIEGTVHDDDGPVADAKLRITPGPGGASTVTSDAQGHFRFSPVAFGTFQVYVEAKHHLEPGPIDATVAAEAPVHVDIALKSAAALRGVVVDDEGHPVAAASLQASSSEPATPRGDDDAYRGRYGSGTSTDAGSFEVDGLRPGKFSLEASANDFVSTKLDVIAPDEKVVVTLSHGLAIEGQVLDESSQPVGAALVVAYRDENERSRFDAFVGGDEGRSHSARAGEDGHFQVQGLVAGSWTVVAYDYPALHPGADAGGRPARHVSKAVALAGRSATGVVLRLTGTLSISGTVQDATGAALTGVTVRANTAPPDAPDRASISRHAAIAYSAVSDADGGFSIRGLDDGTYYVWGDHDGYHRSDTSLQVAAGSDGVAITLKPLAKLVGVVVDPDSKPVSSFTVGSSTFADADGGAFELPLRKPGPYQVSVRAEGFSPLQLTGTIADGEIRDVGTLVLNAGRTVRGTVVEEGTLTPIARARVSTSDSTTKLSAIDAWRASRTAQTSGSDGTFVLEHVPLDATQITADDGKHLPATQALGADGDQVTLTLSRGATVRGTVVDAQKQPIAARVEVEVAEPSGTMVTRRGKTDSTGLYEIWGLPGGSGMVNLEETVVSGNGGLGPHAVTVAEGGVAEVDFAATAGGATLQISVGADLGDVVASGLVPGVEPTPTDTAGLSKLFTAMMPGGGQGGGTYQGLADGTYSAIAMSRVDGLFLVARKVVVISGGAAASVSLGRPDATTIKVPATEGAE